MNGVQLLSTHLNKVAVPAGSANLHSLSGLPNLSISTQVFLENGD